MMVNLNPRRCCGGIVLLSLSLFVSAQNETAFDEAPDEAFMAQSASEIESQDNFNTLDASLMETIVGQESVGNYLIQFNEDEMFGAATFSADGNDQIDQLFREVEISNYKRAQDASGEPSFDDNGDVATTFSTSDASTAEDDPSTVFVANTFSVVTTGFTVKNFPISKVKALRQNSLIKGVFEDEDIELFAVQTPVPSWGLDRIDAKTGRNNKYNYAYDGTGVDVYILDTPIKNIATEFGNRIKSCTPFNGEDCSVAVTHKHGTHVAGTIGSKTYGVAKNVNIHSMPVIRNDGKGSLSNIAAALEWIGKIKSKLGDSRKMVVNISVGGKINTFLDDAVNKAVDLGIVVVAAAGNSFKDACTVSPARSSKAITVAATDDRDTETFYSNYGPCVTIHAPGHSIRSLDINGGSFLNSGTSMAAPHVTGVVALYLQAGKKAEDMLNDSVKNILFSVGLDTRNSMLYSGKLNQLGPFVVPTPPPPAPKPTPPPPAPKPTPPPPAPKPTPPAPQPSPPAPTPSPPAPAPSPPTDNKQCSRSGQRCRKRADCCSGKCRGYNNKTCR